eukprot:460656_1
MLDTILATTLCIILSRALLQPNVATGGKPKCNNYVQPGDKDNNIISRDLYPIGQCYQEDTGDKDNNKILSFILDDKSNNTILIGSINPLAYRINDILHSNNDAIEYGTFGGNKIFLCEQDPIDNTKHKAVEYEVGVNCDSEKYKQAIGTSYDCNGADDQCECEIGGTAEECTFYVNKKYWYCVDSNRQENLDRQWRTDRYVSNMCIQQGNATTFGYYGQYISIMYGCGELDYDWNLHGVVSDSPTCEPTMAPSSAPTIPNNTTNPPTTAEPTVTTDPPTMAPSKAPSTSNERCSESICNGVESPNVDSGNTYYIIIGMMFVVLHVLFA